MNNIEFLGFSDPISSLTHFLAALGFAIGSFFLIKKGSGSSLRVWALCIYSFALVFLFSMSGTFHLLARGGEARAVLQRLDHAGIWVLIAGTFTPLHTILFRRSWRWLILAFVWLVAVLGLTLEVIFFDSMPEALVLGFFLGLGWMGILTGYKFITSFRGESFLLLSLGGIFYSIGAVIDFSRWPIIVTNVFGPHEIFHLFVVAAAVSHWIFVYQWAGHPVTNILYFKVRVFKEGYLRAEAENDNLVVTAENSIILKQKLREALSKKYHRSISPEVYLSYVNEERLDLSQPDSGI